MHEKAVKLLFYAFLFHEKDLVRKRTLFLRLTVHISKVMYLTFEMMELLHYTLSYRKKKIVQKQRIERNE